VRQRFSTLSDAQFAGVIRVLLADISNSERLAAVNDTDDLFDAGILDSFGVLQVIDKIEDKFEISIPNVELVPQNLWSVMAMIELIKRLSAAES